MPRVLPALAIAVLLGGLPVGALAQYTIKEADAAPPKEVNESIRKQLRERAVQLRDAKDALLCEVWFRKEVPGKATPEQIKNGLTYRELPESTLLGVLKVTETIIDYRKQKIKPGVYTLRLAFQPQDGDHMGTAPHPEFCVAVPADSDKGAATLDIKELHELSAKSAGAAHPGVFLLFPQLKPEAAAKLVKKEDGAWAVTTQLDVRVGDKKAVIGLALTLVGVSSAA